MSTAKKGCYGEDLMLRWLSTVDENLFSFLLGIVSSIALGEIIELSTMVISNDNTAFYIRLARTVSWILESIIMLKFTLLFSQTKRNLNIDLLQNEKIRTHIIIEK
ncbi:hypothetical protein LJC74_07560, partial [Eubacteriales bacterium OttesenSCG-928-A19]|nr:hypothetical protein [Eubacteriales bacterium OttesenSCG-928-A19]